MKSKMFNLRRLTSIMLSITLAFVVCFVAAIDDSYAASKSKKYYYLPTSVWTVSYSEEDDGLDSEWGYTDIKYDKKGNIIFATNEVTTTSFKIKYRNKKGAIKSVSFKGYESGKKTYDKKGRLTKIKIGKKTYKFTPTKKGTIKKTTRNGKTLFKIKSFKYYKNGFVKKAVYGNGNVNTYSKDGLMTSVYEKSKKVRYTYKHFKEDGKITKVEAYRNGKLNYTTYITYGNQKTKDVWKYSTAISFAGGPSNALKINAKSAQSGYFYE